MNAADQRCETCGHARAAHGPVSGVCRACKTPSMSGGSGVNPEHPFEPVVNPIAEDEAAEARVKQAWNRLNELIDTHHLPAWSTHRIEAERAVTAAIEARAAAVSAAKVEAVTRVELIDERGRVYTRHDASVEIALQDDGRTLKVFVKEATR